MSFENDLTVFGVVYSCVEQVDVETRNAQSSDGLLNLR